MKVLNKTGYTTCDELGDDNTLMTRPGLGFYLIKNADFRARRSGAVVNIYPIVRETQATGKIPVYRAVLEEKDYENVARVHFLFSRN